jgi:hypothetical protein
MISNGVILWFLIFMPIVFLFVGISDVLAEIVNRDPIFDTPTSTKKDRDNRAEKNRGKKPKDSSSSGPSSSSSPSSGKSELRYKASPYPTPGKSNDPRLER